MTRVVVPSPRCARGPYLATFAAVAGVVLALAAPALSAQTLRWASQGDPQTMDPHSQNELLTNSMNGQVYEALLTRDRTLGFAPSLATEWQASSPTTWRFKLRPGVRFHDGTPFTADDVVYSINRAKEPTSLIRVYANAIGEARRIDDLTVEFVPPQFNPVMLDHVGAIPIMSRVWSEKHGVTKPLDFKSKEDKHTALNANGTGPFVLVSRQPDVRTVYRRNANWWGRHDGNVQEVIYTPIRSDATRTAALISGEVDFVLDPAPQDLTRLKATPGTKVIEGLENRAIFIGMDQGRDELLYGVKGRNPFKDARVRRALYHAVDIEAIRTRLMRGQAFPTGAITPSPRGTFEDPEIERRVPFDLARARALMAEAGWKDGFEVTLDCPNNRYINDEEICVALAAMWSQIGVKVRVNAMPRAQYFPKLEKLDTSMYMLGWGGAITDAETTLTPIVRNRGTGGVGDYNYGNYRNDTLDGLAAASSKEADPAKRRELIKSALKLHNEQVHHIPLHRQVIPWAARANVEVVHRADNWLEWRWITIK
jgi:peptide/nickel transport system substrate-binding protein